MKAFNDTDYFFCTAVLDRVRITLRRVVDPAVAASDRQVVSEFVGCSGAASCGWRHADDCWLPSCPYRSELSAAERRRRAVCATT